VLLAHVGPDRLLGAATLEPGEFTLLAQILHIDGGQPPRQNGSGGQELCGDSLECLPVGDVLSLARTRERVI